MHIHPTAIVDPAARLAEDVSVGPYSIIEAEVDIGPGTVIGPHVVIKPHTSIGPRCRIFQFASIGEIPQDLKFRGEVSRLRLGEGNIIREYVTLNRGTALGQGETVIGDHNVFLAYAHVAHDCTIGNHVIMANAATLAGHITIEDYAIIGGLSAVHQFVRIGAYAFIGGATAVNKDVPPYVIAAGYRAKLRGLNLVGLKRHGFAPETVSALKRAYRLVVNSKLLLTEALAAAEAEAGGCPEVAHFLDFVRNCKRGISRKWEE